MQVRELRVPFLEYSTYVRIVGESTEHAPIILLHGGPGSTHNYMELLDSVADTGRQVISYDQLGCGNSYLDGHPQLWTMETWISELETIIEYLKLERFYIMGQSWGGMLLLEYLLRHGNEGKVKGAVLSSTLPASWLWAKEQHRMIRFMTQEEQAIIRKAEETGDFSNPEYLDVNEHFMQLHCAGPYVPGVDPECLTRPKKSGHESYLYGWGPNEYNPTGSLKDFDVIDRLGEIKVPCLVMSGTDDLCTPLIAKTMADRIPNAKWHLFAGARHMCYADSNEEYIQVLSNWMQELEME